MTTTEVTHLLNRDEAAAYLGITRRALAQLNYLGTGPKFVRVGSRTVRYRMEDLRAYVESNLQTQTGGLA